MRRSYRAAGIFSLSLSRLDIEKPPDDIHRWRRTNSIVTGLWLLAFVQSRAPSIVALEHGSVLEFPCGLKMSYPDGRFLNNCNSQEAGNSPPMDG